MKKTEQYVIVNVSKVAFAGIMGDDVHFVMPGEDAHTYPTLRKAVDGLFDLELEYGHTPETAQIYHCVPVLLDVVEEILEEVKHARRDEVLDHETDLFEEYDLKEDEIKIAERRE